MMELIEDLLLCQHILAANFMLQDVNGMDLMEITDAWEFLVQI